MNQRQIDLKHASLGHLFVLIWVEFTPSKSSFELIDAGPLSLFCNVLKICLHYIWIVDRISYSGAFFFSFQHRRHYLSSKKELKKKKRKKEESWCFVTIAIATHITWITQMCSTVGAFSLARWVVSRNVYSWSITRAPSLCLGGPCHSHKCNSCFLLKQKLLVSQQSSQGSEQYPPPPSLPLHVRRAETEAVFYLLELKITHL